MLMTSDPERLANDLVKQRLSSRFPMVGDAVVARVVRDAHHRFDGHPTREFVPILVEDAARDMLRVLPAARFESTQNRRSVDEPGR